MTKSDKDRFNIREISSPETYAVRHPVLRQGKPLESCRFSNDDAPTTIHYGIFEGDKLAGVLTALSEKLADLNGTKHVQFRGMGVLPEFQKSGLGAMLMQHAEDEAIRKGIEAIWFNAREVAKGFYLKLGYSVLGDPFEIPGVGIHFRMYKYL